MTVSSSSPGCGSSATSRPDSRVSISTTSSGLTPELLGDRLHLGRRQRLRARLHAAQVEEELALRLGRRDLDQPPVAQDVLVDLGPDPVQREADQAHAALRVEPAHGLHESDVAFLDEVRLRQSVADVLAADGDHQPQVRQHQLPRGVEVVVAAAACGRAPAPARPSAAESGSPPGCSDPGYPARPGWGTPVQLQSSCVSSVGRSTSTECRQPPADRLIAILALRGSRVLSGRKVPD